MGKVITFFVYFLCSFVAWDLLWFRDLPEWLGASRFMIAVVYTLSVFCDFHLLKNKGGNNQDWWPD